MKIRFSKRSRLYVIRYLGPVANYKMRKEEIRNKGLVLAVPDEFLKSCKVGNVLFRVWFQVGELDKKK